MLRTLTGAFGGPAQRGVAREVVVQRGRREDDATRCDLGQPAREVHDRTVEVTVARHDHSRREPGPHRREPTLASRVAQLDRDPDRLGGQAGEHRFVADRLHDASAVPRRRVVRDPLPLTDERGEPVRVELGTQDGEAGQVGESDRDRDVGRGVERHPPPYCGSQLQANDVHEQRREIFAVEPLDQPERDGFVVDTVAALVAHAVAPVVGHDRRDPGRRRADHAHVPERGREIGPGPEPALRQAARGIDVGIGEHREAGRHVGESDCPPELPELCFTASRAERDARRVVLRRSG